MASARARGALDHARRRAARRARARPARCIAAPAPAPSCIATISASTPMRRGQTRARPAAGNPRRPQAYSISTSEGGAGSPHRSGSMDGPRQPTMIRLAV